MDQSDHDFLDNEKDDVNRALVGHLRNLIAIIGSLDVSPASQVDDAKWLVDRMEKHYKYIDETN